MKKQFAPLLISLMFLGPEISYGQNTSTATGQTNSPKTTPCQVRDPSLQAAMDSIGLDTTIVFLEVVVSRPGQTQMAAATRSGVVNMDICEMLAKIRVGDKVYFDTWRKKPGGGKVKGPSVSVLIK